MNVIRPWLYISNYRTSIDRTFIQQYQIKALLHLVENVSHPNVETLYMPIEDGVPTAPAEIERGVNFIVEHHQHNHPILVACGAGMSRSAAFTAAGLHLIEGIFLWEALKIVKKAHDPAFPAFKLWRSFCEYYGEPYTHEMLLAIVK